jgi:hypothetical protein
VPAPCRARLRSLCSLPDPAPRVAPAYSHPRRITRVRRSARHPAMGRSSLTRPPMVAMKLAENAPIRSDMNAHRAT